MGYWVLEVLLVIIGVIFIVEVLGGGSSDWAGNVNSRVFILDVNIFLRYSIEF